MDFKCHDFKSQYGLFWRMDDFIKLDGTVLFIIQWPCRWDKIIDYVNITRLRTYHSIPNSLKSNHQKTNFFLTDYLIPAEFLHKINKNKAAIKASFQVAHLLSKQGKSFRDEFIKLWLIEAAKEMCPEERNLLKAISVRTVAQRVENIWNSINRQLISKTNILSGCRGLLMSW